MAGVMVGRKKGRVGKISNIKANRTPELTGRTSPEPAGPPAKPVRGVGVGALREGAYRRPRAGEHLKRGPAPNGSARPGPGSTGTEARTGLSSRARTGTPGPKGKAEIPVVTRESRRCPEGSPGRGLGGRPSRPRGVVPPLAAPSPVRGQRGKPGPGCVTP